MKSILLLGGILAISATSFANTCDTKFMNNLAANYLTLACNLDSHHETKACDLKSNYDDRKITPKRKMEAETLSSMVELDPRNYARYFTQILRFLMARNLYITTAKFALSPSPIGNVCHGDLYFIDSDGQRLEVSTFQGDKYVKTQGGDKDCLPDYHPFNNEKVEAFFHLSDHQRLAELKDKSTCLYYTKINRELQRLVKENVSIDTSSGKRKTKKAGAGRN